MLLFLRGSNFSFLAGPQKVSILASILPPFRPQIGYDAHSGGPWADFWPKMQGLKNSLFFDAHILAIMVENGPPNRSDAPQIFATFFGLFGKVCPRGPRTPKIMKIRWLFEEFLHFFKDFLPGFADTQVVQIRRICRYACFADTQILPF